MPINLHECENRSEITIEFDESYIMTSFEEWLNQNEESLIQFLKERHNVKVWIDKKDGLIKIDTCWIVR